MTYAWSSTELTRLAKRQKQLYAQEDKLNNQITKLEEKRAGIWNKKMKVLQRWRKIASKEEGGTG